MVTPLVRAASEINARIRAAAGLVVAVWVLTTPLLAEDLRFGHLTVDDGLAHTTVWRIHQDSRGYLWVATESTLQRYDGYELESFEHDPEDPDSISESLVMAILEDRQGRLWFGTRSGGLNRYERSEDRFVRYPNGPPGSGHLSDGIILSLAEGLDGEIWVTTLGAGLNRLVEDDGSPTITHYRNDPTVPTSLANDSVHSVLVDRSGTLWVGTSGGLDRFDGAGFVHHRPEANDPSSLSHPTVSALFEDSAGTLWAGTWDGTLHRTDSSLGGSFTRYGLHPEEPGRPGGFGIWAIHEDAEGDLWIGTNGGGLIRFDRDTGRASHFRHDADDPLSLSSDGVLDIHQDRTGMLWLATRVDVSRLDRRWERFEVLRHRRGREDGLPGNEVISLAEDSKGWLWVGTRDVGLTAIERPRDGASQGQIVHYRPPGDLPHGTARAVVEDRHGELWVGTSAGLGRLVAPAGQPEQRRRFVAEPGMESVIVTALMEGGSGDLWVGSESGLYRRAADDPDGGFAKHTHDADAAGADRIYALHEDPSGLLWLGTEDGVSRFDATSGSFQNWRHDPGNPQSPGAKQVVAIAAGDDGALWIGTYGGGVARWQPPGVGESGSGSWRHYRRKDGLAGDNVVAILLDASGDPWIASNSGLSHFDQQAGTFRSYSAEDGLHSDISYFGVRLLTSHGELIFGGQGGLTIFDPARLSDEDSSQPTPVLTAFRLAGASAPLRREDSESPLELPISETQELVLDHTQRTFSFEFSALDFRNPRQNLYAYRMRGYDEDWIETDASRRLARYTNLDPDQYTFEVKAGNKNGVWSETPASVRVTVLPPPWRTWWATALYVLALGAVVLGYVRWQHRNVERERAVNRRLRAVDKLKDEFLANTSHELRTPLYGITGLAESLIDGATGELPEATRANLSMIASSGRRLSHLVNDILDFSKLRHGSLELALQPVDLRPLVDVVLTLSRPLAGSKDLRLHNTVPRDLPPVLADENRLQQILHNLIGNAIKFTESGEVAVSATIEDQRITVSVRDTGIGIPEAHQARIFEAFQQEDTSIERQYGGTGLGLAVTRQLVDLHGGRIEVESRPKEGAVFSFDLPCAPREADAGAPPSVATPPPVEPASIEELVALTEPVEAPTLQPAGSPSQAEDAHILVVDDEPVNRQVLRNYLSVHGYELTLASSGAEALRLLGEQSFDLVLLDIMMPKLSGYEVCRILRASHPIQELPVIFLTAKTQASDVVAGLSLGANDFLTKPISKGELLARMRPHLDLLQMVRHLEELVEEKMSEVKVLSGLLPICASCKKIRDDQGYWNELEVFIDSHSEAHFSHGVCPACMKEYLHDRDQDGELL